MISSLHCRRVHYSYLLFCNFQAMPVSMPFHPLDFVRYSSTVHYWISQVCHYLFAVVDCVRIWAIFKMRYFIYIKFIYSEKAAKLCKIFTLLLSYVVPFKSKVKFSQNFVAFSEYMNFNIQIFRKVVCNFYKPDDDMI